MPDEAKCEVFSYVDDCFVSLVVERNDTCEDICTRLCQQLKIGPLVQPLLGLRIYDEKWFVPEGSRPSPDRKYELRVRFKVPELSNMKALDRQLFNYYYYQLRHDLLQNRISEIDSRRYKNKILGYVVNDMYRKMIEDDVSVSDLKRCYEKYIPQKISRDHSLLFLNLASKKVFESLSQIQNKDHDVDYVKNVYINDIDNIAPRYLCEEYMGEMPHPEEEFGPKAGKCQVKLRIQPYAVTIRDTRDGNGLIVDELSSDKAENSPGLKVLYSCKWKHIANIDEMLTILVDNLTVNISVEGQAKLSSIDFNNQTELNSFVTCLSGYYRLMCKWTVYLCKEYLSPPSLNKLKELKCHGPVGGKFSYDKIREKNSTVGANIIRQCELHYDTYFVDLLESPELIKTYKLTHSENRWHVHHDRETVNSYDDLVDALRNLNPVIKALYRLSPTDNDSASNLLLCRKEAKLSPKRLLRNVREIDQKRAHIFNATTELVINRNALQDGDDGLTETTRADLLLPNNSQMEVTLKLLKSDKQDGHLMDFLQIAGNWANVDSSDIIKLYGMTLCKPIAMVLEYSQYGRLDQFLRKRRDTSSTTLIDIGHSLACALYYLQKNGIFHGHIRCSSMVVTHYDAVERRVTAKLGDPGLNGRRTYTKHDLLWIPFEYHGLTAHDVHAMLRDPKTDVWACTSTLWEIFSRGRRMHVTKPSEFLPNRGWLKTIPEFRDSKQICECLTYGWHVDPDKRIAAQTIIAKLIQARQLDDYCVIGNGRHGEAATSLLNGCSKTSMLSMQTNSTLVHSRADYTSSSYVSNGSDSEVHSNASSENSSHPLISNRSMATSHGSLTSTNHFSEKRFYNCPDYIQMPHGAKVIFQGEIGEGNFGKVYRGTLEDGDRSMEVALKTINSCDVDMTHVVTDFKQEVAIMKKLQHKNIVRFLDFFDEPDKLVVMMEYVPNGSLLTFLGYKRYDLSKLILLRMAKDIANGMHHLFEKNIIHRDLAARNILVQSMDCVKISDFGLARMTDANNYYVAQNNRQLPVRWYAPETLETQKYSLQSDVWSFGVTLYEMFTYGMRPYANVEIVSSEQMYTLLMEERVNLRLPEPDSDVYDGLMKSCFNRTARDRPTFQELLIAIDKLIDQYGELIQ